MAVSLKRRPECSLSWKELKIFLEVIEQRLRTRSDNASGGARLGAVSFIHRFGASLNPHVHFDEILPWISLSGRTACVQIHSQWICHCCLTDGVFSLGSDGVRFHESTLSQADMAAVQQAIRRRVLPLAKRRGRLKPEQTEAMLGWSHGAGLMCAIPGAPASRARRASHFIPDEMVSVDAQVRIEAEDRRGLERLLRYCPRPAFALDRLAWAGEHHQRLVYRPLKRMADGRSELYLTPLELLERLAPLIPPPRIHRHRYHGVFAPNAPLPDQVTALLESQTEPALATAAE